MAHCSTLLKGLLLEQGEVLKQGFQPVSVQLSSMGEVTNVGSAAHNILASAVPPRTATFTKVLGFR